VQQHTHLFKALCLNILQYPLTQGFLHSSLRVPQVKGLSLSRWRPRTTTMSPPVEVFSAAELPHRVQYNVFGRKRKGGNIDLEKCELLEMLQYSCEVSGGSHGHHSRDATIICQPIERLFRRYVL
jgi:hypothetical protein